MKKELDKEILERLYVKEQKSTPEIAKIFGCAHRTIQLRCKKFGIKLRPKGGKLEHLDKAVLQKLYVTEGKSVYEISRILTCSRSAVEARCKEYGIALVGNRKTVLLDRKLLHKLYVDKENTTRDIAKIIGCSRESVRRRCKNFGIPLRHPGKFSPQFNKQVQPLG